MERGTGKTTRLLKATPDGGAFIVHSSSMRPYIQSYIKKDRPDSDILVVSVSNLVALRGTRRPVTIDHTVLDGSCSFIPRETMDNLKHNYLPFVSFVIACDQDGDIVTVWNKR